MEKRRIGTVQQLFCYPVKSMLSDPLPELEIGPDGPIGDRAWALREANGRIATAKKWPGLLDFRANYESIARDGEPGRALIKLPDGQQIYTEDSNVSATISKVLGRPITVVRASADEHARGEIDPQTIFGDVGVERVMPQFTAATLPDTFGLHRGSFRDSAAIHVLATGSIGYLQSLIGGDAKLDARRFRPNVLVDSGADGGRFMEDEWLDGELLIGDSATVAQMRAALRCVMTTHRQSDLPRDMRVLRAAAQHHSAHLGVFGSIGASGHVRVGDPVWLLK
jgi:uncharacterized protein YcbX